MNNPGVKAIEEDLSELLENIPSTHGPRSTTSTTTTDAETPINDESAASSINAGDGDANPHLKDIYNHASSSDEEINPWSK
eukprot:14337632-Ditylum_brightwellii.AAC.1